VRQDAAKILFDVEIGCQRDHANPPTGRQVLERFAV